MPLLADFPAVEDAEAAAERSLALAGGAERSLALAGCAERVQAYAGRSKSAATIKAYASG